MKFSPEDFWGIKPVRHEIGDGGYPNKYWVSYNNDYFIAEDGYEEPASELIPFFKVYGKTVGPFETYREALDKFNSIPIANIDYKENPSENEVTYISIEDRLTGVIRECYVTFANKKFHIELHADLDYTEKEMARRGEKFV